MEEVDSKAVEVWIESERPFTLRLSPDGNVTTDDPEWATVSVVGHKSILVVVSGTSTPQSSVSDLTVHVPFGAHVSAPSGMTAYNPAVEAGLVITDR